MIEKAKKEDLAEILALQKLAYQSEAKLVGDFSIQPLRQTLAELEEEFTQGSLVLKYVRAGKIIGSVRVQIDVEVGRVGKLIVQPDFQNQGVGSSLLAAVESLSQAASYELFTSSKSEKNLKLYQKNGYQEFKRVLVRPGLEMVFLRKNIKKCS